MASPKPVNKALPDVPHAPQIYRSFKTFRSLTRSLAVRKSTSPKREGNAVGAVAFKVPNGKARSQTEMPYARMPFQSSDEEGSSKSTSSKTSPIPRHVKLRKGAKRTLKLLTPGPARHRSITPEVVYTRDLGKNETRTGPTLRIFDGADQILLGRDHPQRSSSIGAARESAHDSPQMIKDEADPTRAMTGLEAEGLALHGAPATQDAQPALSQNVIEKDASPIQSPAQLPLEIQAIQNQTVIALKGATDSHPVSSFSTKPSKIPVRAARASMPADTAELKRDGLLDRAQAAIKAVQNTNRRIRSLVGDKAAEKFTAELLEMAEVRAMGAATVSLANVIAHESLHGASNGFSNRSGEVSAACI